MSKTSANAGPSPQTDWFTRHKVAIIIIVAVLLVDIFITGFMKFGYYVVRCGGIPYANTSPAFSVGRSYYRSPGRYTPGWASTKYFCSEDDAQSSNQTKDPLQGP